jgi:hypothetical protein
MSVPSSHRLEVVTQADQLQHHTPSEIVHNPLHGAGVAADVLLQAAQYCPFKAQCVVTTPHCAACAVVNTSMIACVAAVAAAAAAAPHPAHAAVCRVTLPFLCKVWN